jgi:diaminohydroxyphosphoribosylaminopyrimidine deaminase/5-amino-6-(5-phosphoribosylamino)uracil reductase
MPSHEFYMDRCLTLAKLGAGNVSPNPMVGAVLVYQERVIGEGYHQQYGRAHAEVNCIQSVRWEDQALIEKATLYISLEPCNHHGKTPPCTDLILTSRIPKVVVACKDISAKVNGKGLQRLKYAGIEIIFGIREQEAIDLNRRFFIFNQKHRAYILLKWAESLEGYIGAPGERIKLSDEESDLKVHQWRAEEDGIWVGYRTAVTDNPQLNVRLVKGRDPLRIVYDRNLELPPQHHLFNQQQPTLWYNDKETSAQGLVNKIKVSSASAIEDILIDLYQRQVLSVMVEGGSALLQQLIDINLWDEARVIKTVTSLSHGVKAPVLNSAKILESEQCGSDTIVYYRSNNL